MMFLQKKMMVKRQFLELNIELIDTPGFEKNLFGSNDDAKIMENLLIKAKSVDGMIYFFNANSEGVSKEDLKRIQASNSKYGYSISLCFQ